MGLFNHSDLERRLQTLEAQFENVKSFVGVTVVSDAAKHIKSDALTDLCQALSDQMAAMVKASEALSQRMDIQQERLDDMVRVFGELGGKLNDHADGKNKSIFDLHDRVEALVKLFNNEIDELKKKDDELWTQFETVTAIQAMMPVILEDLGRHHAVLEQVRKRLGIPALPPSEQA